MSTERTAKGGYVNSTQLPKGPNGRALCRQCSAEVPAGRRSFCSEGCIHDWRMRTDTGCVRQQVLHRDKGICRQCGLDTVAQRREFFTYQRGVLAAEQQEARDRGVWHLSTADLTALAVHHSRLWTAWAAVRGIAFGQLRRPAWWDADHILPVEQGGGQCGLDNYQTLCLKCHKAKTAEQARAKALARRQAPLFT